MSKKKLLFIHHCGTKSGAANSLITLIEHLDKASFECLVMCPEGSAFDAFEKIADKVYVIPELPEIISISGSTTNYLRLFKAILFYKGLDKVALAVDELNPDIIHLNEISLSLLARKLKKRNRILVCHARVVLDHKTKLLNKFIKAQLNKFTDFVICIDESVRTLLKGVRNTAVVYNSYQFSNEDIDHGNVANADKFVVLFLANLIRYKGVFDLIEAARILKDYKDIEIQLAGGNSRSDEFFTSFKGRILNFLGLVKNNRVQLQNLIINLDLHNTVKLIGNIKDIRSAIVDSSVNIFPSYMNGPSRSIFEAGVLGKPSIISLYHKVNDVVEDGVTGLVIDEHSPEQIAAAILKLRNDKGLLNEMGNNAKKKYTELNNPIVNSGKITTIYQSLLHNC